MLCKFQALLCAFDVAVQNCANALRMYGRMGMSFSNVIYSTIFRISYVRTRAWMLNRMWLHGRLHRLHAIAPCAIVLSPIFCVCDFIFIHLLVTIFLFIFLYIAFWKWCTLVSKYELHQNELHDYMLIEMCYNDGFRNSKAIVGTCNSLAVMFVSFSKYSGVNLRTLISGNYELFLMRECVV